MLMKVPLYPFSYLYFSSCTQVEQSCTINYPPTPPKKPHVISHCHEKLHRLVTAWIYSPCVDVNTVESIHSVSGDHWSLTGLIHTSPIKPCVYVCVCSFVCYCVSLVSPPSHWSLSHSCPPLSSLSLLVYLNLCPLLSLKTETAFCRSRWLPEGQSSGFGWCHFQTGV